MAVEPVLYASLQREGVGGALQGGDRELLEMGRTQETERRNDTKIAVICGCVVLERLSAASRWRHTLATGDSGLAKTAV